jgi:hypothetical protein
MTIYTNKKVNILIRKNFLVLFILLFFPTGLSFALPAPKYLSVPHWKRCVNLIKNDSAQFVCLPAKKPAKCSVSSWKSLTEGKLINNCQ